MIEVIREFLWRRRWAYRTGKFTRLGAFRYANMQRKRDKKFDAGFTRRRTKKNKKIINREILRMFNPKNK